MVYEEIALQLVYISLGMVLFSMVLNKLLGISRDKMKEISDQALSLQKRITNVKAIGDFRMMQELQLEMMQLMKSVIKKQLLPMCLRCIIFLGIWSVLSLFYGDYGINSGFFFGYGWFLFYFLLAIGWSLIFFGLRVLYKKITGKQDKRRSFLKDIMGILNPHAGGDAGGGLFQGSDFPNASQKPIPSSQDSWQLNESQSLERKDSWKERLYETKTIKDTWKAKITDTKEDEDTTPIDLEK